MADTFTTNLNLTKPEVGASTDTWGTKLNADLDTVDGLFSSTGTSVAMNLDGAVIDSSVIGGTTAAAGSFTTLSASTSITGTLATAAQPNITSVGTLTGLDVNGTITSYGLNFDISDGVEINALESIVFDIDSDNNQTGRVFQVKANNSTALMTITETGNVGIGTSSPTVGKLQVNDGSGAITAITRTSGSTSGDLGTIRFGNTDVDSNLVNIVAFQDGATNSGALKFETQAAGGATAERMRIDSSGNCGIGTSSITNNTLGQTTYFGNSTSFITGDSSSARFWLGNNWYYNSGDKFIGTGYANLYTQQSGNHEFLTSTASGTAGAAATFTSVLKIDSSGNVGIGTASPVSRLTVDGATTGFAASGITLKRTGSLTGSSDIILAGNSGSEALSLRINQSEKLRIDSSGNVGIGVTPAAHSSLFTALDIDNTALTAFNDVVGIWEANTYYDGSNYKYRANGYAGQVLINNGGEFQVKQAVSGTAGASATLVQNFTIDSSGNVGIGTTSPSSGMQIKGDGRSLKVSSADYDIGFLGALGSGGTSVDKGYFYLKNAGTTKIQLHSDGDSYFNGGNVGIGVSPSSEFHVKGDANTIARIEPNNNSGKATLLLSSTGSGDGGIQYDANSNQTHLFSYSNMTFNVGTGNLSGGYPANERMRIDSSGNILFGKTSASTAGQGVYIEPSSIGYGRANFVSESTAATPIAFYYDDGSPAQVGSISTSTTATSYNTSSDGRLKDITGSARGLEVINELNPVSYNWKADGQADEGLIADRKSTRLNSSHLVNSYAVFCLKKKKIIKKKKKKTQKQPILLLRYKKKFNLILKI